MISVAATAPSAFESLGFKETIEVAESQIQQLYLSDSIPWVVAYSGGKDSTATLQLIWHAINGLAPNRRQKPIHVVTNDTLVENPAVVAWVQQSHQAIMQAAKQQDMPVHTKFMRPAPAETFWVNLIGKGYPAPTRNFRWCTDRMKIGPSTEFIREITRQNGEAIIALGVRSAESAARARSIKKHTQNMVRESLTTHPDIPSAYTYRPIVDWSNDDVWLYLMQINNPWDFSNKQLLTIYKSASEDAECPVVIDSSTPSCGNSRFGCWTCTVVDQDKSMNAMIRNDVEKEWMQPLLDIRNDMADTSKNRERRDFRRMNGAVSIYNDENVPGPYTQETRAEWLRKILEAQIWIRHNGPDEFKEIELITVEELREIRRIWVDDKHECEDLLPVVYEKATGEPYPAQSVFDDSFPFSSDMLNHLQQLVLDEDPDMLRYQLLRELLSITHKNHSKHYRGGVSSAIEKALKRSAYASREEAIEQARLASQERQKLSAISESSMLTV